LAHYFYRHQAPWEGELGAKGSVAYYQRKKSKIELDENLDGICVIRASVREGVLSSQKVVASNKSLSGAERAFRSLKTVGLHVRPIYHSLPDRVRAYILRCMLASDVEWHICQLLNSPSFEKRPKGAAR
jgi:hypothetical protein